jgi:hypothetical protein
VSASAGITEPAKNQFVTEASLGLGSDDAEGVGSWMYVVILPVVFQVAPPSCVLMITLVLVLLLGTPPGPPASPRTRNPTLASTNWSCENIGLGDVAATDADCHVAPPSEVR